MLSGANNPKQCRRKEKVAAKFSFGHSARDLNVFVLFFLFFITLCPLFFFGSAFDDEIF